MLDELFSLHFINYQFFENFFILYSIIYYRVRQVFNNTSVPLDQRLADPFGFYLAGGHFQTLKVLVMRVIRLFLIHNLLFCHDFFLQIQVMQGSVVGLGDLFQLHGLFMQQFLLDLHLLLERKDRVLVLAQNRNWVQASLQSEIGERSDDVLLFENELVFSDWTWGVFGFGADFGLLHYFYY